MYTLLSSGYVSNVKTEKGEGAVHLLIPENLSRIGIKLYQFLENFILDLKTLTKRFFSKAGKNTREKIAILFGLFYVYFNGGTIWWCAPFEEGYRGRKSTFSNVISSRKRSKICFKSN